MIIEFQKKCPKHRRKEIIRALWFAKDQLMPRVRKPIFINIRPIRNLSEKAGVYGDCMDEDDREFTIRIDTALPIEDMVSTLLHEMVHVQQYLSGRLKYKSFNRVVFEKAVYVYDMDYDSRPWEVEAWQKEQQLKDMYYGHYTN
jgi:hypothetical protein